MQPKANNFRADFLNSPPPLCLSPQSSRHNRIPAYRGKTTLRKLARVRGSNHGGGMDTQRTALIVLGMLCLFSALRAAAQVSCSTCPTDAVTSAAGPGFSLTRTNGMPINPDPSDPVGACEPIIIKTDLAYRPLVAGQIGAGYFGGQARVFAFPGSVASGTAESTN